MIAMDNDRWKLGPFGSRVLEERGGEIFNLKCLVQFLEGEGRGEDESKFYCTAKIMLKLI